MTPKNRDALNKRVVQAAQAALKAQAYVSCVDVLIGMGWLEPGAHERWRRGQVDCLERVVVANLSRISAALKLFRAWAAAQGLQPRETQYSGWKPRRGPLRFSRSGEAAIERAYRTHWVSKQLIERAQEKPGEAKIAAGTAEGGEARDPR
jgi:hypothetical protein